MLIVSLSGHHIQLSLPFKLVVIAPRFVDGLLGKLGSKEDEMSTSKFTDESNATQSLRLLIGGYPVREVAKRLGVGTKSIVTGKDILWVYGDAGLG